MLSYSLVLADVRRRGRVLSSGFKVGMGVDGRVSWGRGRVSQGKVEEGRGLGVYL